MKPVGIIKFEPPPKGLDTEALQKLFLLLIVEAVRIPPEYFEPPKKRA